MKILLIQTAFIGDVVLATPIIERLKTAYPDSEIHFLLRKGNESVFNAHPTLNKVLIFDKKKNKYPNLVRLIKMIRSESYDYVINVQRFFTTGLITSLSGARLTIGFDKNPLSFLFTEKVKHTLSQADNIHEVQRNLLLIQSLAGEGYYKPRLYLSESDAKVVPTNHEYVCIAPASVWFTKQFPAASWCELIKKIPDKYKIYLIGGKEDVALCTQIKTESDDSRVVVSAGQLTFLQSAALISHAEMTFTNDSAPTHFASALNAPVTTIFCSTVPEFGFGPLSDNAFTIETDEKLACRPCGLHGQKTCPEKHFRCSDIPVDKILAKAKLI